MLYHVGDRRYPFIAILDGEVAVLDAADNEILRHGRVGLPRRAERSCPGRPRSSLRSSPSRCATSRLTARRLRSLLYRGRAAGRPRAVDVHQQTRSAPAGPGNRARDRRTALIQSHDADARVRAKQSPAVQVARRRARGRCRGRGAGGEPRRGEPAAGQAAGRSGASQARRPGQVSRALGIGRELAAARGGRPRSSSAPAPPASGPLSTALRRAWTRSSSRAPDSADRPARRDGSRTTSGSRPGSAARS